MAKAQFNRMYHILPQFLRELREEAGMSQRDIGAILDKPQSYIYNCEVANRRVDIMEFIEWTRACGVNPRTAFSRLLKELE